MTIQETIAEVRRLDKAATPGPWKIDEGAFHIYGSHGAIDTTRLPDGSTGVRIIDIRGWGSLSKLGEAEAERIQRANGALVTTFRTAAPALADAVERRDEVIAKLVERFTLALSIMSANVKGSKEYCEAMTKSEMESAGLAFVNGKWRIEG